MFLVNISQLPSHVVEVLKNFGYDPDFHRLKSDDEGNFYW